MYMIHLLSLILVMCASLAVTSPPPLPDNISKQLNSWKYLSVGESFDFNAGNDFNSPDVLRKYMFFTDTDATLVQNCKITIPCSKNGSLKVTDKNNAIIGSYCTKSETDLIQVPIMKSSYLMISYARSGSTQKADFKCTIKSVKCNCGKKLTNRIVGGTAAVANEIPWQAALIRTSSPKVVFCGATLISPRYLVTAGSCVEPTDSDFKVILGVNDAFSAAAVQADVQRVVRHEKYSNKTFDNDISLIQLHKAVKLTSAITPVCLPETLKSETFTDKDMLVSGWGKTTEGGSAAATLMKVTVKGISESECNAQYDGKITSNMLCASSANKDSCQEDSGGPLTYTNSDATYLSGIVSFGIGCAQAKFPGVYTRVTQYLAWIDSNMDDAICKPL